MWAVETRAGEKARTAPGKAIATQPFFFWRRPPLPPLPPQMASLPVRLPSREGYDAAGDPFTQQEAVRADELAARARALRTALDRQV